MKFFIGPVSINTINTIINYSNEYDVDFVFIPSRRQIEYNGGYVNNFTTSEFINYVKSKTNKIKFERDHAGPNQGKILDDGYESLKEDCKFFDIIHIDPWKKYANLDDAVKWTVNMINYCYSLNKNIVYEIGTEEGIRPIECDELDLFVQKVKSELESYIFDKIKYLVIQCGTKLLEQQNIGIYDEKKLLNMIKICEKYNLIAKEHNGDWISSEIIKSKEKAGLTCINIAPEFGEIESTVIIDNLKQNSKDFEDFFNICYKSNTWKKWVSENFNPFADKEKIIKICGHYNFNNLDFIKIKNKYPNLDKDICKAIKNRLMELQGIYTTRRTCIMCQEILKKSLFETNLETPICYSFFENRKINYFIPYNIFICSNCDTVQNKYLCDLKLLYQTNHIDNFGIVKHNMHNFFADFISSNKDITGLIEIGACHDYLSRLIFNKSNVKNITIIDPSFIGNSENLSIIEDYFENCNIEKLTGNTIVMSSVFEHFYFPLDILNKLKNSLNIEYIYLNHPNLDYALENDVHINLTAEHTFYVNNSFINDIFHNYGFDLIRMSYFDNHTINYEFKRKKITQKRLLKNNILSFHNYLKKVKVIVDKLNKYIENNPNKKYYIWPASMHIVPLFIHGFNYNKLNALLDNSPNKIGKIFYGYNINCESFVKIVNDSDENTVIILGGAPNYKKELDLKEFKGYIIDI